MSGEVQVIWFKRDLRVTDHRPLWEAHLRGPIIPVFFYEKSIYEFPDYGDFQRNFLFDSLEDLDAALAHLKSRLLVLETEAVEGLQLIYDAVGRFQLWSHEETGNWQTYQRDISVTQWAAEKGITWKEFPQNGVIRRLKSRDAWARKWEMRMIDREVEKPKELKSVSPRLKPRSISELRSRADSKLTAQKGGSTKAIKTLDDFLERRGAGYRTKMSSPLTAYDACSRLSAHLALGTISMKTTVQRARTIRDQRKEDHTHPVKNTDIQSFLTRCHWHCHFMQKLELEPEIEFLSFNRNCDSLRNQGENPEHLEAWVNGNTGYPFVDACIRSLKARGWLNFRMRAMILSFAAYDLWLDWRDFVHVLARWFVDYEPGIHYSQIQMQSGTTGINTLRIYNPIKQGKDHDPDGIFIKRWVPELSDLPSDWIHEPWSVPNSIASSSGFKLGKTYPKPIVDHPTQVRFARSKFRELRNSDAYWEESRKVQEKHGSRSPREQKSRPKRPAPKSTSQSELHLGFQGESW